MIDIPAFLDRRTNGVTQDTVADTGDGELWRRDIKPPKAKKWKDAERVNLILADQCPKIGSGNRYVWAKVGRKWVYLADDSGNRGRLSVKIFNLAKRG